MGRKRGNAGIEWPAYTVERWPIARLKAYERNARTHSAEQIEQLRRAIKAFGWTVPVLAREDGTLIAGHGRLTAALAEGITEAPVIVARGWSEEQCRAYALADNKIALNSGWDDELLGVELSDLRELGMDLDLTGFAVAEVDALLAPRSSGLTDPDARSSGTKAG